MSRVAIITGITGQDGSYLTELLLSKKYTVYGLVRRCSLNNNTWRIQHLNSPNLHIQYGDVTDVSSIRSILSVASFSNPERLEIYNLAAQSHVQRSFEMPEYTLQSDGAGVLHILEAIRTSPIKDRIRFYQASTSELYGKVQEVPQKETTPFYPRSPYGVAKQYGFWIVKNYRESYGLFATNGILFNHESPRRGEDFVTRKITKGIKDIQDGKAEHISIGNLEARRDWGHAKDYVEAMWRILQADEARDWVVATGVAHSVREFVEAAFKHTGTILSWVGEGLDEVGICELTGKVLVRVNPAFFRPAEVDLLIGDSTEIRTKLGWNPEYTFESLVKDMMEGDVKN
ncbi:GDP-mannose 4,6-dehydratase [bacterium]|nr:GDP-mannose 4,6-dehydratase [bacterium]